MHKIDFPVKNLLMIRPCSRWGDLLLRCRNVVKVRFIASYESRAEKLLESSQ